MTEEVEAFMNLATQGLHTNGLRDARKYEEMLRQVLLNAGGKLFLSLLELEGIEVENNALQTGEMRRNEQPRTFQTLFGPLEVKRTSFYRYETGSSRVPFDEALGIQSGCTPALLKLLCRAAARESYAIASEDLEAFAGIRLNGKRIHRAVQAVAPTFSKTLHEDSEVTECEPERMYIEGDGTGIPLRAEELKGRKGRQADGSAKTHEVKVGAIFTQKPRTGKEALRDPDSTSYIATMERTEGFGEKLLREARRRNLGAAQESVFISDGAKWLKEIARTHFPAAIRVVDYYHAAEHLHDLGKTLYPHHPEKAKARVAQWKEWLLNDQLPKILRDARKRRSATDQKEVDKQLHYFESNKEAMRYGHFRKRGIFIGSGVVEAGCKTVVCRRMKHSGAFWSKSGAAHILDLRAALASQRFDSIWDKILNLAA